MAKPTPDLRYSARSLSGIRSIRPIEYDRAVILEQAGHVHESVEALEHMLEATSRRSNTLERARLYARGSFARTRPHAETLIRRALTVMPDSPRGARQPGLGALPRRRYEERDEYARARLLARPRRGDRGPLGRGAVGKRQVARRAAVWAAALARDPESKTAEGYDRTVPARCALGRCGSAALLALATLAGCRTLPPPPLAASAPWQERRPQLQALQHFQLKGRVALSAGTNGFNANLRWFQDGPRSQLALEGPLGVGGMQISANGDDLDIINAHGEHITSAAAHAELSAGWASTFRCPACVTGCSACPIRPSPRRSHWTPCNSVWQV